MRFWTDLIFKSISCLVNRACTILGSLLSTVSYIGVLLNYNKTS